jgi:hypothetical protein
LYLFLLLPRINLFNKIIWIIICNNNFILLLFSKCFRLIFYLNDNWTKINKFFNSFGSILFFLKTVQTNGETSSKSAIQFIVPCNHRTLVNSTDIKQKSMQRSLHFHHQKSGENKQWNYTEFTWQKQLYIFTIAQQII